MLNRFRKVIAAAVVCILITGIAAYAQTQAPRQQRAGRQGMQQGQQMDPQGAHGQQARERMRARMGSLQAMLMPPSPEMIQKLAERLGLTQQQKEQIKQLYATFGSTVKPIREQKLAALKAFMTAFKNPSVTKAELQSLSEPILKADQAILDAEFDFWLAFRPILNQQQQAQFQSFMQQKAAQEFGDGPAMAPPGRQPNPARTPK